MKRGGVIVGSGIVGSAVGYELSRRGLSDLHVIDPDRAGSLSSSERNAGGVRHLWQQSINTELSRLSIELFTQIKDEIGFKQTGYLWLYKKGNEAAGEANFKIARSRNLDYEKLSPSDIKNRYPFLDKLDDVSFALLGRKDGIINSNALKVFFQTEAEKRGVRFHDRTALQGLTESGATISLRLSKLSGETASHQFLEAGTGAENTETWEAGFVILACGPWMKRVLPVLDIPPLTSPIRRQIALFKSESFDMTPYGMVVDTSRVYFHPEGGNILAGLVLKEEPVGFNFSFDSDFFENHIWPPLYERSSSMEKLKPLGGWGGLYSYTPDTAGILGRLPKFKQVYEIHSFTGRGVMQAYGAAVAMADLVTLGKFDKIDASCLGRERFLSNDKSKLLPEGLHI